MRTSIRLSSIFVPDQDAALEFYVGILGMEVHTDVDLGFMRWLTICAPGDRSREILLDRLQAAGVDFTDELSEKDYGVDFGIRDPFGNRIRIGTMKPSCVDDREQVRSAEPLSRRSGSRSSS